MTIVELMMTITILVVVWGGATASQMAASDLVMTGRETGIATADLRACMERLLVLPVEEIPAQDGEFAPDQPIALYEELHLSDQRIVASYPGYTAGDPVPDRLPIVLRMTWNDFEGRPRTMELATLKAR